MINNIDNNKLFQLTTEAHSFEKNGDYFLFFPMFGLVFRANNDAVDLLEKIKLKPIFPTNNKQIQILLYWEELGLINNHLEKRCSKTVKKDAPVSTTLLLTTSCNFSCIYCYANANHIAEYMDIGIAKAAIDYITRNSLDQNEDQIYLGIHGGGEPTFCWSLFVDVVEYFNRSSKDSKLIPNISIGTNGYLDEEQRKFIVRETQSATVSFDGMSEEHNFQRPLANGTSTYDCVLDTLKYFDEQKYLYGIRVTVTNYNVSRLSEFIQFIGETLKCKQVKLEPVFLTGKADNAFNLLPKEIDFIHNYIKAMVLGRTYNIDVLYSGVGIRNPSSVFCSIGNNFFVTHSGDVTPCLEVLSKNDIRSKLFFYGNYNKVSKGFEFDISRLNKLEQIAKNNFDEKCVECIARSYCAGDCMAKQSNYIDDVSDTSSVWRCNVTQELTKELLIDLVHNPIKMIPSTEFESNSDVYG